MMRSRALLVLLATLILAVAPADVPAQEGAAIATIPPLQLTLKEAIVSAFKNNLDVKVDSYLPFLREHDLLFQMAQFDANLSTRASYEDSSTPFVNFFGESTLVFDPNATPPFTSPPFTRGSLRRLGSTEIASSQGTQTALDSTYLDPLRTGGNWSANLLLVRQTQASQVIGSTVFPSSSPETYFSQLTLTFNQPLLRNLGRRTNDHLILLAQNNQKLDKESFRARVLNTLSEVESAYWTLVFARRDLDVRNEALKLAQELLKLNQIKVQVGTLPPIDITQAEAGVASREEDVIIADAAIQSAQDRLRRVMGMDPNSSEWRLPIVPTEDLTMIVDREVDLQESIKTAIENRPDLAQSRLLIQNADVDLLFRRNQLRYSLDLSASYILAGLEGDTREIPADPNDRFPADPNSVSRSLPHVSPNNNPSIFDALHQIPGTDFPTYRVSLTLGIPIGNRAAESQYTGSRLAREQASIAYSSLEQQAIVDVSNAVRRVVTDRKRIDAAEKNRILQEKKVEAEQKKFENGLSTSFQVLTFQSDLAEARSRENQARTDYRISMAALDQITGVLDRTLDIRLDDYPAH